MTDFFSAGCFFETISATLFEKHFSRVGRCPMALPKQLVDDTLEKPSTALEAERMASIQIRRAGQNARAPMWVALNDAHLTF
jgi:hypothetical protein